MKHFIKGLTKFTISAAFIVSLVACGGAEERKIKYLEKGKAYLEEKNYEKAKIEFKNVLQIDPKYAEAHFYMGQLQENKKELGKAVGNYKKAIELNPDHTLAKVKLAKIYVVVGTEKYIGNARKLLEEVKLVDSKNSEANLVSGTIEYKTGNKLKAVAAIESVVKEDKKLVEGISLLSSIYLADGKELKAEKLLTEGVENNVNNIPLRISLAKLQAKNKNLDLAEKYLKESIEIEPDNFALHVALATFYATSNQVNKAERVLRQAIKDKEDDAQRYLMLVELLFSRVSLDKGIAELKTSIELKPELYELQFALARFYKKTGKISDAKSVLNEVISEKAPVKEGLKARNELALLLIDEGDSLSAKSHVKMILDEYPNNNDALLTNAKLSMSDFDPISAINALRTVVKNNPKNTDASLLLAQAHELNNESSLAENELKRSIEQNPLSDQTHVNYARYLGSKGRVDEAIVVVDKALTYFKESYDLMELKLKDTLSKGQDSRVLTLLDQMEQANANRAEVNVKKGQYYLSKRDLSQAIEQFEKAHKKSKDKYKTLQLIIKAYVSNQQPKKALDRLQVILDKNPEDAVANLLTGQVYLSQKNMDKARDSFLIASKTAEQWFPPYSSLASIYLADKKLDKALDVYRNAVMKLKNKVPAQMQMAAIYENKKDFSAAMSIYQDILTVNASNKLAANNYASLLLDHGGDSDVAKALELAKNFEKMRQPALKDTLAWAYAKSGDNAKAVAILNPIVEKAPKVAVFRYHLGYALYENGDKAAAKSHLKIAVESKQKFLGKDKAAELLKSL